MFCLKHTNFGVFRNKAIWTTLYKNLYYGLYIIIGRLKKQGSSNFQFICSFWFQILAIPICKYGDIKVNHPKLCFKTSMEFNQISFNCHACHILRLKIGHHQWPWRVAGGYSARCCQIHFAGWKHDPHISNSYIGSNFNNNLSGF